MIADTLLLTLPYYICSVAAWGTMATCAIAVRKRMFARRLLFLVAGMAFLGVYFFLLAASAQTGGYIDRALIAWQLRALAAGGGVLWLTWLALWLRAMVTVEHKKPAG